MDPFEKFMQDALAIAGFVLLALVVFALPVMLHGCAATVTHEVPAADRALDIADRLTKPKQKTTSTTHTTCENSAPTIRPVQRNVRLIIEDGEIVDANQGGKALLFGYFDCMDWSSGMAKSQPR